MSYSVPESLNQYGTSMLRNIRNSGTSNACCGNRFAAVNSTSIARLNLKLNRASTNAADDASSSVITTDGTVMTAEL